MEGSPELVHFCNVGDPDQKKAQNPRWPSVAPFALGLLLSLIAFFWAPWERVHPMDTTLREPLGYAPLWSHRFVNVAGASVDWSTLLVSLFAIWAICLAASLMLHQSARRD